MASLAPQFELTLEAQLRATLNVIPAHTWYALPSGALTFVNEKSADYLGLPRDHPLRFGINTGGDWDSHIPFLHPDDHEETRRVWSTCLRTGCAGEVSFRVRNATGGYRWFLSRAEPLRASDGALLLWVGVNFDIEELKRAEFYIAEGERLAHMGSWAFDPAGFFNFWSRELFHIYGLGVAKEAPSLEEYLASVHSQDREFMRALIQRMVAQASGCDVTKRIVRPNGELRYIRCVGAPVVEDGTLRRIIGTAMDVTEQELLTEELRKREMELQQMLDFMPQYLGVLGADGTPIYANRASLDYLGMTLDEWLQRKQIGEEVHPDDLERVMAELQRALSTDSAVEIEERVRKGDGSFRWFLSRCSPVRDENGRTTRLYLASVDINDRKEAEERLRQENIALREEVDQTSMFEEIIGTSPALRAVLARVSKVAPSDSTVLVTGETGTGKELIARAIHRRSRRMSRPFVSVNCAAIPRDLIASELFGHERGAFTGATQRRLGRFELADGGTIFLDEVGELLPDTQVALLRVLQERELERVGGGQPIHVDVRIIAATNRNLTAAVANGTFRPDLFYRLNVFPIKVPALRERKEDILMLVEYFVQRYASRGGKNIRSIEKKTFDLLQCYEWPGNIRELQNVIERSVILSSGEVFSVDELWLSQETSRPASQVKEPRHVNAQSELRSEREIIEAALAETRGRVSGPSGAAAKLRIPPSTLEHRIRALKINKRQFKFD